MQCDTQFRFRCRPHRSLYWVSLFLLAFGQSAIAAPPPAGVAPTIAPSGGFGIDGDLLARQPTAASGDWVVATNQPGTGQGVLAADGTPLDPTTTFHFIDPYNDRTNDLIFTGGSKWTDDPNTWVWTVGKPSSKADINNLVFHMTSDQAGHTWLVLSADRASTQGDSYIDLELLQNPIVRTATGGFVSSGPHGGRTTNDLVLSLAFGGGGKVADFLAWRWSPDGEGGYHYVDVTALLPAGGVFVALNSNTIAAPYAVFGSTNYPPNAFAEAAIDLTAMIDGVEPCEPFGFVAIMVKTKVATSDSAGIEDFLDPIAYDFRIGPLADAGEDQTLCAEEGGTHFLLNGSASAGLAPVVSTRWTVVSGTATLGDSNALATSAQVFSPSATLRLEVVQLNGCTDSDEVVLNTVPSPAVVFDGPSQLCPGAVSEFSAPPGMDTYHWTVSGNGLLLGPADLDRVTVASGSVCGEPLVLTLVVVSNICTVEATANVPVIDTVPPALFTAPDRVVECGMPWDFDPVSALDDCSGTNVLIEVAGTVTNQLIGETFSATRTWQATDPCGNTSTATQTVTLVDTTPPQILCSSNVVVECAGPLGTEAFFIVTATDTCDAEVPVVCSPPSGTRFPFGVSDVICVAVDDSGNTNQCSFTVTVQDTTPPEITCPADVTRDTDPGVCEAVLSPGSAIGSDICADVSVAGVRSDGLALTNPYPKGVTWITWTATDDVGLTNACVQTITVIDTEPPTIECPTELLVAELPEDSGSAVVTFDPPAATDNCDPPPVVTCDPPSGSTFPVGDTLVGCVATDAAGNTNFCTFVVRVIPYRVTVVEVTDSGPGGLREAIHTANALPAENRIEFNIPGPGPHVIRPETNLPALTGPVVIDARTQPGYSGTPVIYLDGALSGDASKGLTFESASNAVFGLAIYGFNDALRFNTNAGDNLIQGNYLGVDGSGTNGIGNSGDGLRILSANNLIGGSGPGEGNLIAANEGAGIRFLTAHATNNRVEGNAIGVSLDATIALPNGGGGIVFEQDAANNRVGSTTPAMANVIAFNGGAGITLTPEAGTGNSDDSDQGPNGLQNAPELSDARSVNGITTVEGSLTSRSGRTYRLDFYLNDEPDPSGYGEGQTYLGFALLPLGTTGTAAFTVSFPVAAIFTQFVTATATDPDGNTSEFSEARPVRTPPIPEQVPSTTNVVAGTTITLCADASGSPPIYYQWRLNGANIPGETNQCITLTDVEAQSAGSYTVVVYNDLGGFGTQPAALLVTVSNSVPAQDDFADRQPLGDLSGLTRGSNEFATREPGEPLHAGKPGGASIWYSLALPPSGAQRGIFTVGTRGSTFDTLLAVYEGDHVTNLTAVASDEDRGGFFTSGLRFNAIKGRQYAIAIDGYFGETGEFVLGWTFEETPHLLPVFLSQPRSQSVRSNATAIFTADASVVCGNGITNCPDPSEYPKGVIPGLVLQWFFDGQVIPGATNETLIVPNVQPANLGGYWLEATAKYEADGVNRTVRSDVADLQINQTGVGGFEPVLAWDKFQDALLGPPWQIGGLVPAAPLSTNVLAATGLTSGYTGTQIFNTVGSSSSSEETLLCDVPGGSSEWVTVVSQADGLLTVDTAGSDYETILAIYILTPTNPVPQLIDCNVGNPVSALQVPVTAGDTNTILVDGQYGASGTLVLNYSLIGGATLQAVNPDGAGGFSLRVVGYPGMNFTIECSSDLFNWIPLITTNSADEVFQYSDPTSSLSPGKFYRAVFAP